MKKRTIIFFCPKIINDGLKKTLEIYLNYFERYYKIILVTNTTNLYLLKKIYKRTKIINPRLKFFLKINLFNYLLCVYLFNYHRMYKFLWCCLSK